MPLPACCLSCPPLERADEDLRRAEACSQILGDALERSDAAVAVLDADGSLTHWTPHFASLAACDPAAGMPFLAVWLATSPESVAVHEAIAAGTAIEARVDDGAARAAARHLIVRVTPIRAKDGALERTVVIFHDVSERRRMDRELEETRDRLARAARLLSLGEQASAIGHELNQPLAAIANYCAGGVRRLEAGTMDAAGTVKLLRTILDQAERAGRVIRRLRERTKRPIGAVVACSLPELVGGVAEALKDKLDAAGVELRAQWGIGPAVAIADPVQVEIIVSNLLRNAAEAIAESGAAVRRIEVSSEPAGADRIALSVCDSGPGIPEGALSEMFELMHSTRSEGTGLGLWLSRCLAEANGGALSARRNGNGGMSFVLELPRAEGTGEGASAGPTPMPRSADAARSEEAPHVS